MPFIPPTTEELEVVARLKERFFKEVTDVSPAMTDTVFLRFYRGMKLKEEETYTDLLRYHQWRKDNDVDNVETNHAEAIERVKSMRVTQFPIFSKENYPATYNFSRRHNKNNRELEDMRWFIIYAIETLVKNSNPEQQRCMIVMDLKGFGLHCMDYEVVKILLSILQANYPETMEKIFIVDAPFLFSACWAIIRPWLDPVTAAKISFTNRAGILECFDESVLPPNDD